MNISFLKSNGGLIASFVFLMFFITFQSCTKDNEVLTPVPQNSITFKPNLSDYQIYEGDMYDLMPSNDFQLLELSAPLFTDYAEKQRLVKIPTGTQITAMGNGLPLFPDQTILVKTFYYNLDARDLSMGKKIIETRLLIKEAGTWNVATYVWNDTQTEATLRLDGFDTSVSWITETGTRRSTIYHVPDQRECATCHQINSKLNPIGPKLRNLNRTVLRNGNDINQLEHLISIELLSSFNHNQIGTIPNYMDQHNTLAERARAYLEMNCAHCHNPSGFQDAASQDLDLRFETNLSSTGLLQQGNGNNDNDIISMIQSGEMPLIGTTLLDEEGVALLVEYINSL